VTEGRLRGEAGRGDYRGMQGLDHDEHEKPLFKISFDHEDYAKASEDFKHRIDMII
jgi:hypothetical protein